MAWELPWPESGSPQGFAAPDMALSKGQYLHNSTTCYTCMLESVWVLESDSNKSDINQILHRAPS